MLYNPIFWKYVLDDGHYHYKGNDSDSSMYTIDMINEIISHYNRIIYYLQSCNLPLQPLSYLLGNNSCVALRHIGNKRILLDADNYDLLFRELERLKKVRDDLQIERSNEEQKESPNQTYINSLNIRIGGLNDEIAAIDVLFKKTYYVIPEHVLTDTMISLPDTLDTDVNCLACNEPRESAVHNNEVVDIEYKYVPLLDANDPRPYTKDGCYQYLASTVRPYTLMQYSYFQHKRHIFFEWDVWPFWGYNDNLSPPLLSDYDIIEDAAVWDYDIDGPRCIFCGYPKYHAIHYEAIGGYNEGEGSGGVAIFYPGAPYDYYIAGDVLNDFVPSRKDGYYYNIRNGTLITNFRTYDLDACKHDYKQKSVVGLNTLKQGYQQSTITFEPVSIANDVFGMINYLSSPGYFITNPSYYYEEATIIPDYYSIPPAPDSEITHSKINNTNTKYNSAQMISNTSQYSLLNATHMYLHGMIDIPIVSYQGRSIIPSNPTIYDTNLTVDYCRSLVERHHYGLHWPLTCPFVKSIIITIDGVDNYIQMVHSSKIPYWNLESGELLTTEPNMVGTGSPSPAWQEIRYPNTVITPFKEGVTPLVLCNNAKTISESEYNSLSMSMPEALEYYRVKDFESIEKSYYDEDSGLWVTYWHPSNYDKLIVGYQTYSIIYVTHEHSIYYYDYTRNIYLHNRTNYFQQYHGEAAIPIWPNEVFMNPIINPLARYDKYYWYWDDALRMWKQYEITYPQQDEYNTDSLIGVLDIDTNQRIIIRLTNIGARIKVDFISQMFQGTTSGYYIYQQTQTEYIEDSINELTDIQKTIYFYHPTGGLYKDITIKEIRTVYDRTEIPVYSEAYKNA